MMASLHRQKLKITGGKWKNRTLISSDIKALRPTQAIAREALMNMIQSPKKYGSLQGLKVADLAAGTGMIGLEMLSRGAGFCLFIEQEPSLCRLIHHNCAQMELVLHKEYDVKNQNIHNIQIYSMVFDIIFMDPPYNFTDFRKVMELIIPLMHEKTMIIVQTAKKQHINFPESLTMIDDRISANAHFHFFILRPNNSNL